MHAGDYEIAVASSVGERDGLGIEVSRRADGEVVAEIFHDDLEETITMRTDVALPADVARRAMAVALTRLLPDPEAPAARRGGGELRDLPLRIVEDSRVWEQHRGRLLLDGHAVNRVTLGVGLELTLNDGVSLTVRSGLRLISPHDAAVEIDPERPTEAGLVAVHGLLGSTIDRAAVRDRCTLDVTFTDGVVLEVPGEQPYEAWTLRTTAHELVIAMPSVGRLAYWDPDEAP